MVKGERTISGKYIVSAWTVIHKLFFKLFFLQNSYISRSFPFIWTIILLIGISTCLHKFSSWDIHHTYLGCNSSGISELFLLFLLTHLLYLELNLMNRKYSIIYKNIYKVLFCISNNTSFVNSFTSSSSIFLHSFSRT